MTDGHKWVWLMDGVSPPHLGVRFGEEAVPLLKKKTVTYDHLVQLLCCAIAQYTPMAIRLFRLAYPVVKVRGAQPPAPI